MQLRLDRSRALVGFAVLGISVVIVAIVVAPRSRGSSLPPAPAPTEGTCTDLAREVDPSKVPVDSGYDPEKNLVYAHVNGRTYVMGPEDPVCRSLTAARTVIDHTMEANTENMAAACGAGPARPAARARGPAPTTFTSLSPDVYEPCGVERSGDAVFVAGCGGAIVRVSSGGTTGRAQKAPGEIVALDALAGGGETDAVWVLFATG